MPAILSAYGSAGAVAVRKIYVDSYGADPTGVKDSTAAIRAAQAAGGASPYVLVFGVGSYTWGTSQDIRTFDKNQGLEGQGHEATFFTYLGNNAAIPVLLSTTFSGSDYGGNFTGFNLSGYSAGASAYGIQYGDLQGIWIDDVLIAGFGGAGIHGKNVQGWSEEATVRAICIGNKSQLLLDGSSFDYSTFDLVTVVSSGADGITLNNAKMQGTRLRIRGNYVSGTGNTGAVIAMDRGNASGTSYIINTQADVAVESVGSSTGHYTVYMGSQLASSQFIVSGVLSFANVATPFQGIFNPFHLPFGVSGIVNDTTLGTMSNGDALACYGAIDMNQTNNTTSTLFSNEVFFNFGDIQTFQLASGANVLSFQVVPSGWARRTEFVIRQPASGAAGTVTWPGTVKWAGGSAPALSAANNALDWVRLLYLPVENIFLGELVGKAYA